MTTPVLVKGGTIVNSDRHYEADVLCQGGKIVHIAKDIKVEEGMRIVDARGKFVMPGGIDPHTHMELNFMGAISADDFYYGTRAAIAGGTTMLIDFVIPGKGKSLVANYEDWRRRADAKVICDYGLHCAVTWFDDQGVVAKEMAELVSRGVQSFKMFMAYKGVFMIDDEGMMKAFAECKKIGALAQVHAENGEAIDHGQKNMLKKGITGPEGHCMSRPEEVEGEATNRAIMLADRVCTPVYIVHVMSKSACDAVSRNRREGKICYGEPIAAGLGTDGTNCWHHDWRHASAYVMGPPLRPDPTTKEYLMKHLASGDLQVVGTDNCTFNGDQKAMGKDDFTRIPNGVNGLEDRMGIVWEKGVHAGVLTPSQFVAATSTNAAKLFGCYPEKGVIEVGADADIVVWDPDHKRVISAKTHHHAVDFNIFEGMEVHGYAHATIAGGRVLWESGEFTEDAKAGTGRYVPRRNFGYAFEGIPQRDAARLREEVPVKRAPYTGPVFQP